jgi:pimeloyl-ACP methyl ester carboxylesterase
MKYVEYGKENNDTIILLHGGGLCWWNYEEVAEELSDEYHLILPILDGHAGSDRSFTTISDNAKEIIDFIDEHFGGRVLLIGGLSLGAQILLEILSLRKDVCKFAIVESALVIPSRLTYSMIEPSFGGCYGLIKQKWFSRLQFKSLRIKPRLFDQYYRDTCAISKRDLIAFMQENSAYYLKESIGDCTAEVHIFVGEKEGKIMHKSAQKVKDNLQNSGVELLFGLYHGEFSINFAKDFAKKIKEITDLSHSKFNGGVL